MNFFFLMNPLETFKSFVYDFQLIELSSPFYFSQPLVYSNPDLLIDTARDFVEPVFGTILFFKTTFVVIYVFSIYFFYVLISHKDVIAY